MSKSNEVCRITDAEIEAAMTPKGGFTQRDAGAMGCAVATTEGLAQGAGQRSDARLHQRHGLGGR